ncbi:IPT/TIG domain-containing protein [bacterium]|nr:IPT/TIG domain-containing protein [bacterium]
MPMRRFSRYALAALVALVVPACQQEPPGVQQQASVPLLTGRILPEDRAVAAALADIANGATVALIDAVTGQTVATTVSSPSGAFSLYTTVAFNPVEGRPYYVEASKGLAMGGDPNRAGASVARMRTLLFYQGGNWLSLASPVPGASITIGWATTTLSVISSLRNLSPAAQLALAGRIAGSNFNATGTVIDPVEFQKVYALVDAALRADQDPLEVIFYDPTAATLAARYGQGAGPLVIHDTLSPQTATRGGTVTVTGQNLPAPRPDTRVWVGDMPVAGWSVNANRSELRLTLGSSAYGGILKITQGSSTWYGPYVPVKGTVGTLAGNGNAVYLDGRGTLAGIPDPIGLAADSFGTLYVASGQGYRIRKLTTSGLMTSFVGTGGAGTTDGPAGVATVNAPHGLAFDAANNLYVCDYAKDLMRRVTPSGMTSTIAGTTSGYANGPAATSQLFRPTGVAADASGNVYVAEQGNHVIRKITPNGQVLTYAGVGLTFGSADGPVASATFNNPASVALDTAGNLYVADEGNNRIRKIDALGSTVTTLNATPLAGTPFGLTLDSAGNVYVACRDVNVIQKVTPGGTVSTLAGSGVPGTQDGALSTAQFSWPHFLVFVGDNLYVTDRRTHRIRVITP